MQRIALLAGLALALAGCSQVNAPRAGIRATKASPRPPSARRSPPRYISRPLAPLPPPLPRTPPPQAAPRRPHYSIDADAILPPGRIRPGRWRSIVVHHSAGATDTPQTMDRFHRTVRNWENGLGYHFVIGNGVNTVDGRVYPGPRWYRQLTGAHCKTAAGNFFGAWRPANYFNDSGIGICLIGHFDQARPTAKQLQTLEELLRLMCQELGIPPANIYTHGQVTGRTECPGQHLSASLASLRAAVARQVAFAPTAGAPRSRRAHQ